MVFDKDAKTIQWGKACVFNKWFWENWISTCKKNEIRLSLSGTIYKN